MWHLQHIGTKQDRKATKVKQNYKAKKETDLRIQGSKHYQAPYNWKYIFFILNME